jgi:amino acid adenylation domain-containing protein/non-ribosomal peptide synthase protein (TIGR01720 family)
MLEDSGARILLTQERLADSLPVPRGVAILCVDTLWPEIAVESADSPVSGVTAENLCYVIYTSGSTGRPKGVAMHHRGVTNYIDWGVRFYRAKEGAGAPVFTSMAVDLTISNFLPLFGGLPVHLLPEDNPVAALADAIKKRPAFGLIKITPTHLSLLTPMITAGEAQAAAQTLVIGADFLNAETTLFWQDQAPRIRLMNEYGPTETVVGCSAYIIPPEKHRHGAVPVGRPIQNLRFYVLNTHGQPVPAGMPGELFIGGVGVAHGYLGRRTLTAEQFVPDPFSRGKGERMYRTGDRARWLKDGNLTLLGRSDRQVKLRGYRVELGEVEAVLRRCASVKDCLVTVREDVPGDRRLVGYVVGKIDETELRDYLKQSLPEYMTPSAFVKLESLPLTSTGKFDTKALPAPEYGRPAIEYVEPRTAAERTLAGIWSGLLRIPRVGVTDNFFGLGGDSILAIQVVSRARNSGLRLTPRQIFERQTIAELAQVAECETRTGETGQVRSTGPSSLTPIQKWFFDQDFPAPSHYNQSMLFSVDRSISDAMLEEALMAVLERHDVVRLRFERQDTGWEARYGTVAGIELEHVDLSGRSDAELDAAQARIAGSAQSSLDLERGPLGRAILFDRGQDDRVLLLILHHLIVDGVSWRILQEDLETACRQLKAGERIALGPKTTSYQRWAEALQVYAHSEEMAREADYWAAQSADGVAALPAEGDGWPRTGPEGMVTVRLNEEETRELLQDVPVAYRTQINDVLLCALAETISNWTGSTRFRLALEGHGREPEFASRIELDRTVGWFTNVYPVVLDITGAATSGERLKRVKEELRTVPKRGIGYSLLRYLTPDPQTRRSYAADIDPEIAFNYLGQFDQNRSAQGCLQFRAGPRGQEIAGGNRRSHALVINGSVRNGCLRLHWIFADGTRRRAAIERVAAAFLDTLRRLIIDCRQAGASFYTPSDFPLAKLHQAELDKLFGRRATQEAGKAL